MDVNFSAILFTRNWRKRLPHYAVFVKLKNRNNFLAFLKTFLEYVNSTTFSERPKHQWSLKNFDLLIRFCSWHWKKQQVTLCLQSNRLFFLVAQGLNDLSVRGSKKCRMPACLILKVETNQLKCWKTTYTYVLTQPKFQLSNRIVPRATFRLCQLIFFTSRNRSNDSTLSQNTLMEGRKIIFPNTDQANSADTFS